VAPVAPVTPVLTIIVGDSPQHGSS
jgi:hypothetical protein